TAQQAADFEKTLGERREASAAEFNAQMAKQDEALAAVQERADLLAREAEEDHAAKTGEAARVLESARTEAAQIVRTAKEQADRVRRDSERELAAATARRDSITAQLSNVRNMLATLGGPAAAEAIAGHDDEPVAEDVVDEPVAEDTIEPTEDATVVEDGAEPTEDSDASDADEVDEVDAEEEVDEEVEPEDEVDADLTDEAAAEEQPTAKAGSRR
ncbi:MAG: hypothetical protein IE926_16155, partial [Micrococcales bacterium]|nr:hypothetical protein [Micrococcales bacterium]